MKTDYDEQAENFKKRTGLVIKRQYIGHRPYFKGEKEQRAVWQITFEREGHKPYQFTFGDSLHNSYTIKAGWPPIKKEDISRVIQQNWDRIQKTLDKAGGEITIKTKRGRSSYWEPVSVVPVHQEPSDYDILSCIEKRGCLSFSEFCADFGLSDDSIKARETYLAVQEQAAAIQQMFTGSEIEELETIQ